jgi:hypothetical protein
MKNSFDINAILTKVSYGDRARPVRDWFVLLAVMAVLVGLSVGWNVWLLRNMEKGGTIGTPETPSAFDTAPIESVRAVFESRAEEEARYENEYRFVDPSR